MKKVLIVSILTLMSFTGFSQSWISNGENMASVRTKLNQLKALVDSLEAVVDSISTGEKTITLDVDTLTNDDHKIYVDTSLKVPQFQATEMTLGDYDNGDYVSIDRGGDFKLHGDAVQWEDVRIEPVARTTGTYAPTFEKYYDDGGASLGVYLYSFDDASVGSQKEVYFSLQLPHAWNQDTIWIHVHWVPDVSQVTATPYWGLEYTWIEPGKVYGSTTTVYKSGNHTGGANLTADTHYITEFSSISPSADQDDISSILIGRLFRFSSNALDTYTTAGAKCGLLYIDAHIKVSSLGSDETYIK